MKLWIKDIVECEQTDLLKGNEPVIKVNLTIWTEDNRVEHKTELWTCLLYTSPSPRDS